MLDGYPVADVDIHLIEPVDLWQRYIEPAYRDRAPFAITQPVIPSPPETRRSRKTSEPSPTE